MDTTKLVISFNFLNFFTLLPTINNHCLGFGTNKTAICVIETYVIEGQSILSYWNPQADRSTNRNMQNINLALFTYYPCICFLLDSVWNRSLPYNI